MPAILMPSVAALPPFPATALMPPPPLLDIPALEIADPPLAVAAPAVLAPPDVPGPVFGADARSPQAEQASAASQTAIRARKTCGGRAALMTFNTAHAV